VNLLDVVLVIAAIGAVAAGYRLGFTNRVLSWIGLVAFLALALLALPWVLRQLSGSDYVVVMLVAMTLIVVAAAAGQTLGLALGARLTPGPTHHIASDVDHILGGVAGLLGLLVIAWLILPLVAVSPGWPSELAADSVIARSFSDHLPEAPDIQEALRSLVGDDNYPEVFATLEPPQSVVTPPTSTGIDAATATRVAASVVKVGGLACQRILEGTGFVAGDDLVVTNAHVVAGERTTSVQRDDGRKLPATVVAFDPRRDLALLAVNRLNRVALPLADAHRGDTGGVFGHPGGEPLRIAPFEVARTMAATGRDIYDSATVTRQVLELAAELRPGDSGSALVDPGGGVGGVAFAISSDHAGVAYALATSEVRAVLALPHDQQMDTGPCLK
jgi:S1-C subfamily serine protease